MTKTPKTSEKKLQGDDTRLYSLTDDLTTKSKASLSKTQAVDYLNKIIESLPEESGQ